MEVDVWVKDSAVQFPEYVMNVPQGPWNNLFQSDICCVPWNYLSSVECKTKCGLVLWNTVRGCLEGLWMPHPWRYSNLGMTGLWAPGLVECDSIHGSVVGTRLPLPTRIILWESRSLKIMIFPWVEVYLPNVCTVIKRGIILWFRNPVLLL